MYVGSGHIYSLAENVWLKPNLAVNVVLKFGLAAY